MRELFDIVKNNFDPDGERFLRPSVRGIIIKDGKVALVHSLKYDYYKFPGGGKHPDEDKAHKSDNEEYQHHVKQSFNSVLAHKWFSPFV